MTLIQIKRFLRISCLVFFSTLFNSCITSKNKAIIVTSDNISVQRLDSLPLIPKDFLKKEKLSKGYCLVRGKNGNKVVALTFDDGPTNLSNKILDVLNKNGVKATFFWLGKNLVDNREIIKKAKKSKHQIANHSWNHTNGYNLDENVVWEQQVSRTIEELKTVAGIQSNYY